MRIAAVLALAGLAVACPLTDARVHAAESATVHVATAVKEMKVGLLELEGAIKERQAAAGLFGETGKGQTLRDVIAALNGAAKDDSLAGVVIRLKDAELTATHIQELAPAIKAVRDAGKKVHLFAEGYGPDELRLGALCDRVLMQSGGGVMLPGVHIDEMYLADMFAWAGIKADFVQVGDFKGASEMYANSKPSKAWEENINGLLDSMYGELRAELKAGRKLDDAKLDKAMEEAWLASDTTAVATGLVDEAVDLPNLEKAVAKAHGSPEAKVEWSELLGKKDKTDLANANPFTLFSKMFQKPDHSPKRATIAVVHIDGAIVDGESTSGGLLSSGSSVGSRTIRRALAELEENDLIKGVILRIDSPGGSAIASEVIWQGVRRVAAKKPVWASVGGMAASGGYYIAVGADKIYLNPSSIVGSIGVVGGKFALGGLMEKLHINIVPRSRGPRAGMMSIASGWSDADKAFVKAKMTETYEQFTGRVTQGRKEIDLSKTAEGRLFTGQKAIELKMADRLGGVQTAINDLAKQLSLASGSYDVMDWPAPKGLEEMLENLFGGFGATAPSGQAAGLSLWAQIDRAGAAMLGQDAWRQVREPMSAAMQMQREPVLLIGPRVLIFR